IEFFDITFILLRLRAQELGKYQGTTLFPRFKAFRHLKGLTLFDKVLPGFLTPCFGKIFVQMFKNGSRHLTGNILPG
ncbi:hypothetical protein, partial [Klebsiella pneumoniae]|uniref:hypothetical protein n=1 Tax=Klebsiella pneumoniae TaxID=573 RepID=UPI001C704400